VEDSIDNLCSRIDKALLELASQKGAIKSAVDIELICEMIESGTIMLIALREIADDKGVVGSIKKMFNGKVIIENSTRYIEDAVKITKHYREVISEQ
jgi:hypothetical protein